MNDPGIVLLRGFPYEMILYINMFSSGVVARVFGQANCPLVVLVDSRRTVLLLSDACE